MGKIEQSFPLFDLNIDGLVHAEEVYTFRNFHEIRTQLIEFAPKVAETPAEAPAVFEELIGGILGLIEIFETQADAIPNGVTPTFKMVPSGNPEADKLITRILLDYRQATLDGKTFFKSQLVGMLENAKQTNYFQVATQESNELRKIGETLSANFTRTQLTDGEIGISPEEMAYFDAYREIKTDVPSLNVLGYFSSNYKIQATVDAVKVKSIIKSDDPVVAIKLYRIIDELARLPTGAKILRAFAKKIESESYQIRPLADADKKNLSHVRVNAMNISAAHAIVYSEDLLRNTSEDKFLNLTETFAHEMFHAVVPREATTFKEEYLAHEIARLVLWEQGLSPTRDSGISIMSPIGKAELVWNLYSPHLYTGFSEKEITARENSFQPKEWEVYIETQTDALLQAGLEAYLADDYN